MLCEAVITLCVSLYSSSLKHVVPFIAAPQITVSHPFHIKVLSALLKYKKDAEIILQYILFKQHWFVHLQHFFLFWDLQKKMH